MKRMCKKWANVIFALSLFVVMSAGNLQAQSSNVVSDWTLSDGVKVGGARAYAGLHYPNSAREGRFSPIKSPTKSWSAISSPWSEVNAPTSDSIRRVVKNERALWSGSRRPASRSLVDARSWTRSRDRRDLCGNRHP